MTTAPASSQTREGNGSMDEIKRLKVKLREREKERNELAVEYNKLVDEYGDVIDQHSANVDLVYKKIQRIRQLKDERMEDVKSYEEGIEGLQEEIESLKNNHKRKIAEKSRTIRRMVEERDDLQKKLSEKAQHDKKAGEELNFEVKQSIAASTRLDKQLGDEAFRKAMDQIYERLRDCFMVIRRREPFDVEITLSDDTLSEFLSEHVPSWKDNSQDDKLYVCISLVSRTLTRFVNNRLVFGYPNNSPIQAAWWAWKTLAEGSQNSKSQQDVKRWLALTSTVLTDNHRDLMIQARQESLDFLLEDMKDHLEAATTLSFTDAIRRKLSDAISPHLTVLRMLHFQEWNYKFDMVSASRAGRPIRFSRARMAGMFWEDTGFVQASLFPKLCRLEENDEDEDETYTIIYKARVAVVAIVEEEMRDIEEESEVGGENMQDAEEGSGQSSESGTRDEEESQEETGEATVKLEDEEEQEEGKKIIVFDSFDKEDEMDLST
ncbi:hypothetical protein D6D21_06940 [Aureobasidium pullulans]|uniref:Uncharacterized protein n=1 Tax=Aureobasidium pullulans TaxID=5580 RepID=A0AB74ITC5_AURPU|nr:hypothetical protein D6D21_06940 [Aureobasidium pullulans]